MVGFDTRINDAPVPFQSAPTPSSRAMRVSASTRPSYGFVAGLLLLLLLALTGVDVGVEPVGGDEPP